MKLIECHIDGFGKLIDENYIFEDGLNQYVQENGYGKSTLAIFIKTMFYGFEKKGNMSQLRENYRPWMSDRYGGSLDFEIHDQKYRIMRKFGKTKNGSQDEFHLISLDTFKEVKDYSSNIGEEIFKMDALSYTNTLFNYQNNLLFTNTNDLDTLLSGIADQEKDIDSYDQAVKVLEAFSRQYGLKSTKKEAGFKSMKYLKNRISDLDFQISSSAHLEEDLNALYKNKKELEESIEINNTEAKAIDLKIKEADAHNQLIPAVLEYRKAKEEMIQLQNHKFNYEKKYPFGLPEKEEVEKLSFEALELYRKSDNIQSLNQEEKDFVNKYDSLKKQDLDHLYDLVREYDLIEQQRANASNLQELKRLAVLFKDIDQAKILDIENKIEQIKSHQHKEINLILIITGIVLSAVGLILALLLHHVSLYLLMALGVLMLIAGFVLNGNKYEKAYRKEIEQFLTHFNISYNDTFVIANIEHIKKEYDSYCFLKEQLKESQKVENPKIKEEILAYLAQYYNTITEPYNQYYFELVNNYKEKDKLLEKEIVYSKEKEEYEKEEKKLLDYLKQYNVQEQNNLYECFIQLNKEIEDYEDIVYKLAENTHTLESLITQYSKEKLENTDDSSIDIVALTKLKDEYDNSNIYKQLTKIDQQIEQYQNDLDKLSSWIIEKQKCQEEYNILDEKIKNVDHSLRYLKMAKESLDLKYIDPLKEAFDQYYQWINEDENKHITIDVEKNIHYDDIHTIERMSEGMKDLISICLRLSLIKVLFDEEKPVLIFDDPFVNLDDKKVQMGVKLLKKIADDYQVIYFTCHHSRI